MSIALMSKSKVEEDQKQGIVSILASDSRTAETSLRRALSADMSSAKWLSSHTMKRVASSEEFSNLLEGDDCSKKEVNAGQFDIWSSIMSQNDAARDRACSAPYIHPLVKRSGSGLSEKSLEVCTESLGSETGSDGFSGDLVEAKQQQKHDLDREDARVGNYRFAPIEEGNYRFAPVDRKSPPPLFPPPLPSLTSRRDGQSSLRVMPRRGNGRLVLEAVSVSSAQNNFRAERKNGRLVLSFLKETEAGDQNDVLLVTKDALEYEHNEDENDVLVRKDVQDYEHTIEDEDEDEEEENEEGSQIVNKIDLTFEQRPKTVKLHRLAQVTNPSWAHKFNDVIECDDDIIETVSVNGYDYCWRAKPTTAQAMEKGSDNKHIISKNNSSIITNKYYNWEKLVVIKGKKLDYIVPSNFNGCKENRRSLFQEPYCIATL